jgi:3-phenylpropionate/trans-cinnamate dioxygenase ferredoxin reductase subunit
MANDNIVIVGGGQAGGEIAIQLRKLGHAGPVVLVAGEPHIPYKRPPLSKAYLAGDVPVESLHVVPRASLDKANVALRVGVHVSRIDRANHRVELADGGTIGYGKLALATGGRPRELNLPGAQARNVLPLRTIADVDAIRARCARGARMVIVGGGFIGLEVAAVATKLGLKVTVLEGLPRVLARVTVPQMSAFFERVHRDAGVDLRTGTQVTALEGEPDVQRVVLADGTRIDCDFIVVGIGIVPNVELAAEAGLAVDNGVVVDEQTRTTDPDVVAAGDCTNHPNAFVGRRIRLESVQNAMEQGRVAAATLAGKADAYRAVPWFWSDQYDVKLQMVGLSAGFDQFVLRGDPATSRSFGAFYLRDGHLIAADTVNRPADFMFAKKLVASRVRLDAAVLADETVALKSLVPAAAAA